VPSPAASWIRRPTSPAARCLACRAGSTPPASRPRR